MPSDGKKFRFRNFTSFTLFFSFIVFVISGIALYMKPEGDMARWIGWTFLGLTKKEWEGFHVLIALFFLVFGVIHFCYNWKVLLSFCKDKISKSLTLKRELVASCGIVILFLACILMQWQPFWKVAEWRQSLKKNKNLITIKEPEAGFAKKKMTYLAQVFGMSADELILRLNQQNIKVGDPDDELRDVAKANNLSPEKVYIILTKSGK